MLKRLVVSLVLFLVFMVGAFLLLIQINYIECRWFWCEEDQLQVVVVETPTLTPTPQILVVTVEVEKEVTREVQVTKEVAVTRQVPVEVTREVVEHIEVAVTQLPQPTATPLPTYTLLPTYTPRPTYTPLSVVVAAVEATLLPEVAVEITTSKCRLLDFTGSEVIFLKETPLQHEVYYWEYWHGEPELLVETAAQSRWQALLDEELVVVHATNLSNQEGAITVFDTSDRSNWGTIYYDPAEVATSEDWPSILVYPEAWCLATLDNLMKPGALEARRISVFPKAPKAVPHSLSIAFRQVSCTWWY